MRKIEEKNEKSREKTSQIMVKIEKYEKRIEKY